jgi:branched-chain amino acid transport system permease protein
MRRYHFLVTAGIVVIFLSVAPMFLSLYFIGLLNLILIYALFAMSLDLIMGYTGLPSFGHAAFFGLGGYFAAILTLKLGYNFSASVTSGVVASLVFAAIIALVALRAKSHFFLLITLAINQMVWSVAWKWTAVTGGDMGLSGIPRPNLAILNWNLEGPISYYYFVLIIFILLTVLLYVIVNSPFSYALRGIRENEERMMCFGYHVWLYKYLAFILGAAYAGLAGTLHVYYFGYVGPHLLSVVLSTEVMLMVILGGEGTLFGSIIGAAIMTLASNLISIYSERFILVLGFMYILVVLFWPQGVYHPIQRYMRSRQPK